MTGFALLHRLCDRSRPPTTPPSASPPPEQPRIPRRAKLSMSHWSKTSKTITGPGRTAATQAPSAPNSEMQCQAPSRTDLSTPPTSQTSTMTRLRRPETTTTHGIVCTCPLGPAATRTPRLLRERSRGDRRPAASNPSLRRASQPPPRRKPLQVMATDAAIGVAQTPSSPRKPPQPPS